MKDKARQGKTRRNYFFSILSYFSLCIFIASCANENLETLTSNQSFKDDVALKNGRLYFESKESFGRIFEKYADATDDKIIEFIQPLYEKGFYSLRPIVTEKNEAALYDFYKNRVTDKYNLQKIAKNKISSRSVLVSDDALSYLDDLEGVIGDDTFGAFLNSDAEIQVGSDIYKYTDVGLFIVDEERYTVLNDYLDINGISNDLIYETSALARESIFDKFPNEGLSYISKDLVYFNLQSVNNSGLTASSSTSSYTPTSNSVPSTDPSYNSFLSNLTSCDPHSGLFGSLFGDNDVCIDQYENRRRVKTKAFNYNYFLVYHLGVKCVNQYRGWTGFWRVEATDEIRLVVEAAQFEYDTNKLINNAMSYNALQEKAYYLNDRKILFQPNNIRVNNFVYSDLNASSLLQIFQNTGQGLTFEFFGTGLVSLDNLIENGIQSSLSAKKVNEYFYSGLYGFVTSQLRTALSNNNYTVPDNRTFVAKFAKTGKVIIQKAVLDKGFNSGVRSKTFDFGAEIKLQGSDNSQGNWSISNVGPGDQLIKPKNLRIKIIGAVRHGSSWHGSKFQDGIE